MASNFGPSRPAVVYRQHTFGHNLRPADIFTAHIPYVSPIPSNTLSFLNGRNMGRDTGAQNTLERAVMELASE
jgi:hypothetical protein